MIFRFQPARLMTPLIFILLLGALSYYLKPEPWHHLSVPVIAAFVGGPVVLLCLGLAMRARSYLKMDERGLEIKYIVGSPQFYAWTDIESARIFRKRMFLVPVMSTIRLRLRPSARSANVVRRAAGNLTGADVTFLAAYDESPQQILEKIQMFQRNHGAMPGQGVSG